MDYESAVTTAGIDPKILDNWQSDSALNVASWDPFAVEQPPEWDTSQDSSQADAADLVDLGVLQGSFPTTTTTTTKSQPSGQGDQRRR